MSEITSKMVARQWRPGGWFKVPGVPDPVGELVSEVERLELEVERLEAMTARPKAKAARPKAKVSASVDTRTPED